MPVGVRGRPWAPRGHVGRYSPWLRSLASVSNETEHQPQPRTALPTAVGQLVALPGSRESAAGDAWWVRPDRRP